MSFEAQRSGNERCAYCHDLLVAARPTTACPGCRTVLHDVCWRVATKCPTLGCKALDPVPKRPSRMIFFSALAWSVGTIGEAVWSLRFDPHRFAPDPLIMTGFFCGWFLLGIGIFLAAIAHVGRTPRRLASWVALAIVPATCVALRPLGHALRERPPFEVGAELMEAGRYREALEYLPRDPRVGTIFGHDRWARIALCHEKLGEYQAALAAYDQARSCAQPWEKVELLLKRAHCMSRCDGWSAAARWLETAAAGSQRDDAPRVV